MSRVRRDLAIAGLAGLGALAIPAVARAQGWCGLAADFAACEAAHHTFIMALGGAGAALLATLIGLVHGLTPGQAVLATDTYLRDALAESEPQPPDLPPPPPLFDPWTGEPLIVQDGSWEGAELGQIWYGGGWVSREEAIRMIQEDMVYVRQRDAEREAFWADSMRLSDEWLRQRVAANEAEAARERAERQRLEDAWQKWQQIEAYADGHDYADILSRIRDDDRVFNPDGSLNVDYVERLGQALRNRIGRDIAAPDEQLQQGWVGDFAGETARDIMRSTWVRILVGIQTAGSSEVIYQSYFAAERMRQAAELAVDRGRDYDFSDAVRTGMGVLADENLPIHTVRALGNEQASWWDVTMAAGVDLLQALNVAQTVRNLRGSARVLSEGGGLRAALTHNDPIDLLAPFRDPDPNPRLWRDPSDVTWQTEGVSVRHLDPPSSGLPSRVQVEVQRVTDPHWRSPTGAMQDQAFRAARAGGATRVQQLDEAFQNLDAARSARDPAAIAAAEEQVRQAAQAVQADKNAIHVLNERPRDPLGNDWLIRRFNAENARIADAADAGLTRDLAQHYNLPPEKVQIVKPTNIPGQPDLSSAAAPPREYYGLARPATGDVPTAGTTAAPEPTVVRGDKASFDRDITARILGEDGVWRDVPAEVTGTYYNRSYWEAATGQPLPTRIGADGAVAIDDAAVAAHAQAMDQTPTSRLSADAYGSGPGDLETATMGQYRHRDFSDPHQVGQTVTHKVDEWAVKADQALADGDLQGAMTNLEEAQRQLVKQYDNLAVNRTQTMVEAGQAPGATVPEGLAEQVKVLQMVGTDGLTPAHAEEILRRMGSSTEQLADQLGRYVTGQQVLRPPG